MNLVSEVQYLFDLFALPLEIRAWFLRTVFTEKQLDSGAEKGAQIGGTLGNRLGKFPGTEKFCLFFKKCKSTRLNEAEYRNNNFFFFSLLSMISFALPRPLPTLLRW